MSDIQESTITDKLKDIFWPIKRSELALFVPMALMMLCVLFNFGTLRSIKDSLVVPNIGAEVISFLKLWMVLPSTIIFTIIYVKISNVFNSEHVFYLIISSFLGFFVLFAYVLFPNQDLYHPSTETIDSLIIAYPHFKWFIHIFAKWSYALMYIFCELWSVVIINLLFWQYANHIFDTDSAKRFYPILGMIGNIGLVLAGNVLVSYSDMSSILDSTIIHNYASNITFQCHNVLKPIITFVVLAGITAMVLYRYISCYILRNNKIDSLTTNTTPTKTTLSVRDSIKLLFSSKYIGHIVLLVLCYGLLINILEGPWKSKVTELYPNTVDYMNFMGKFNIWMGVSCISFMVIGSNIIRKCSWLSSALVTPYMLTCTGLVFFGFIIFAKDITFLGINVNPIYYAVIIGAVQNILSKSTKYSLFDSTKEMAYIPLSLELKTKGKAAVEVIGLKFGKSLGAFIQSFMFIIMPMATFDSVTIYLLGVFIAVMIIWIWNMKKLNKEYIKLREESNETN